MPDKIFADRACRKNKTTTARDPNRIQADLQDVSCVQPASKVQLQSRSQPRAREMNDARDSMGISLRPSDR
jgi:hypothetical protein